MSKVMEILEGHVNEILGNNGDLGETRLNICKQCLIFKDHPTWGYQCDAAKYISPDGND